MRKGAFGNVYRTIFRNTDVAVKTLTAAASASKEEREEFVREIGLVMNLAHPRLVIPMASCTKGPILALVTEWMNGGTRAKFAARS